MGLEELRQKMAKLGRQFGASMPDRVSELADLVATARADRGDNGTLETARIKAHSMKGTAGTFGFHQASKLAGTIEKALVGLGEQSPIAGDDPAWENIGQHLDELRGLAHKARSEGPT